MKTLTIIDTFGFLFRSYFALPPLKNHEGFPTGLLTGFAKLIMQIHRDYPKDYLVFALDSENGNFRKKIDPNYKANRPEIPNDLKLQLEVAIGWVEKMGFKNISIDGYEADDVIASINKQANNLQVNVRIISHDKDLYQLIDKDTFLFNPTKKEEIREKECLAKYGVLPKQFIDFQSIVGDSTDNVPGIRGIGAKGAATLLQEFQSLDNIYANLENITSKRIKSLLIEGKESAYISKQLVTLRDDLLDKFSLDDCEMPQDSPLLKILSSLKQYDLNNILTKLNKNPITKKKIIQLQGDSKSIQKIFNYNSYLLDDDAMLQEKMQSLTPETIISFDTETTSLNIKQSKIVGLSFSIDGINAYYVPIGHNYLGIEKQVSLQMAKKFIQKVFECQCVIGHNIKYDLEVLQTNFDFIPKDFSNIKDSMLIAWLLQSDSLYGLDFLMKKYFNHEMIHYKDIVNKNENFSQVLIQNALKYASEDAAACDQLYFKIHNLLDSKMLEVANNIEFPFIKSLIKMESTGIKLDLDFFQSLKNESKERLYQISEEIFALADKRFNLNSPQQLAILLFEDLNLQAGKKTKSGYSTSESVLNSLYNTHPIIPKILEYREAFKLHSTYIDPLIEHAKSNEGHRIYTSFMQTGTSTGRLSSKNPNLQNIPVKTAQGRRIREGFIAKKDHLLLSLDYSQIELRLLAHFSEDKAMLKAFLQDADIHLETAKKIFGESQAHQKRSIAKSINFGLIYGMGPKKLSETLNISFLDAKTYIQNYFESFPTVKDFLKNQEIFILENGYSKTLLGRVRKFDFKDAQDYQKAAFLREGINAIFQGSAADIIKMAMNAITKSNLEAQLLLQVHDELIFECPEKLAQSQGEKIKQIMENITILKAPLKCSIR
ncbi:MAG: DNA polymerase I, partial [Helicobacter sp.]|nr:DNA polymerase I [Helicobacter sp.]